MRIMWKRLCGIALLANLIRTVLALWDRGQRVGVVHGTSNLRVVDASYFPLQVRGNLANLVYAVAERAADFIEADKM